MLVDAEAVLLDLKVVLASKKSHGGDALLVEIARLETRHRLDEGLFEKALRVYGVALADDLLRPTAFAPTGRMDGHDDDRALDAAVASREEHHAPHRIPVGTR